MKRVIRTVWISMLTGLAFLVACTSHGKLTRAERKQLKNERTEIVAQLQEYQNDWRVNMEDHLLDLGPSIVLNEANYAQIKELYKDRTEELALLERLLSIDKVLNNSKAVKGGQQQRDSVQGRIELLKEAINNAEPPKVYGPPTISPSERQRKMDSIQAINSRQEQALVYGPPKNQKMDEDRRIEILDARIDKLQSKMDSIGAILQRREGACIYGSPEVLERYKQENDSMRNQLIEIQKEILRLKDERENRSR